MGELARSVLAHGGRVTGIIPAFLSEKERMLRDADELIVVEDMHQRKKLMFDKSDAFVALPGGIGTLEELVEQLTWAQLGRHTKPIVLVNIDGFWAPLLALLRHMSAARPSSAPTWTCASPRSSGPRTSCRPFSPAARSPARTGGQRRWSAESSSRTASAWLPSPQAAAAMRHDRSGAHRAQASCPALHGLPSEPAERRPVEKNADLSDRSAPLRSRPT